MTRDDFVAASDELESLAEQCDAGAHRQSALLLLAAAELDVANRSRSPDDAAKWSAAYLRLPDTPPDGIALARTLFRLAGDYGGVVVRTDSSATSEPGACSAGDADQHGAPPSLPPETSASRLARLEAQLAAREDSIASLEHEIKRIGALLTSGAAPERRQP